MPRAELLLALRIVFLALAGSVVLAWLRNPLASLLAEGLNLLAIPLRVLGQLLTVGGSRMRGHTARALDGLSYSPEGYPETSGDRGLWAGWALLVPFVWLAAAAVAAAAEAQMIYLRNAGLLNMNDVHAGNVAFFLTLAWLSCPFSYGLLLAELLHASPLRQPFGKMRGQTRTVMLAVGIVGFGLSVTGAVLSLLWGQLRLMGIEEPSVGLTYLAILVVLVTGTLVLAGWSLPVCLGAVWVGVTTAGVLLLGLARVGTELLFRTLDTLFAAVFAALEVAGLPGLTIWNWLVGFPLAQHLRLSQIEWEQRPRIGAPFSTFRMPSEHAAAVRPLATLEPEVEPDFEPESHRPNEPEAGKTGLVALAGVADEPAIPRPSIIERRWENGKSTSGLQDTQP